jgi:type IV pilus biogenesis protein CpaD/CtpE
MRMRHILLMSVLAGLAGCAKTSQGDGASDDSLKKALDTFNRRTIYESLDPTILAGIADNELEQAVVDYVAAKLAGCHGREEEALAVLPAGARALWLTWVVEGEVNNGGFNQYYWNTNDRFAADAVDAFRFFSATEHASLMQEANRVRAQESRTIQEFKDRGSLDAFSESYKESKLGPLDERFYDLKESLSALRTAKIRSAPELFSGN